jgi:hypothetical protein
MSSAPRFARRKGRDRGGDVSSDGDALILDVRAADAVTRRRTPALVNMAVAPGRPSGNDNGGSDGGGIDVGVAM